MINHNLPNVGIKEINYAKDAIIKNNLSNKKIVRKFEDKICKILKIKKDCVVACSSGSAAIFLAMKFLNPNNQKVGIPIYSCKSLKNSLDLLKIKSEFIDNKENSPNIDIYQLKKKKIKYAIIPHTYGVPVDTTFLIKNKIKFVEDCSHSFGSFFNGKFLGLHGSIGIASFSTTKLITTGGHGGIVFSKNIRIINKIRKFLDYDKPENKKGFNLNMPDINAAIGLAQLEKLKKFKKKRQFICKLYKKLPVRNVFSDLKYINKLMIYRFVILHTKSNQLKKFLKKKGINAINPIEKKEMHYSEKKFYNSELFCKKTLSLPLNNSIQVTEVKKIFKNVKLFLKKY
jgi:perosamine synthetase